MYVQKYINGILISICALQQFVAGQNLTLVKNPCNHFQYINDYGRGTAGLITLPNDFSQHYELYVNMSVAANLTNNEKIYLELLTPPEYIANGFDLRYRVQFPIQYALPILTKIELNGAIFCSGPPEPAGPRGVTNFWASTSYSGSKTKPPPRIQPPMQSTTPSKINTQDSFFNVEITSNYPTVPTQHINRNPITSSRPITRKPTTEISNTIQPPSFACGMPYPFLPLITLGVEVIKRQYPWLAAILYSVSGPIIYRCTGSIVSKKHVISAAECGLYFKPSQFTIISGEVNIGDLTSIDYRRRSLVSSVKFHPEYDINTRDYGIAIFVLQENLKFNKEIRPICLWKDSDSLVGKMGTVASWGSDQDGTKIIDSAEFVVMPVVSQKECAESNTRFQNINFENVFCAGNRNGSGVCNGDGGAGLIIRKGDVWYLRGVLIQSSNKDLTCDLYNYFLFFDITKATLWLDTIIT